MISLADRVDGEAPGRPGQAEARLHRGDLERCAGDRCAPLPAAGAAGRLSLICASRIPPHARRKSPTPTLVTNTQAWMTSVRAAALLASTPISLRAATPASSYVPSPPGAAGTIRPRPRTA